jgi:hypothetical protein
METKSLVAAGALVLGFWAVLTAWTFTGLASMSIPGSPSATPAPIEQRQELVAESRTAPPAARNVVESDQDSDEAAVIEVCIAR